VIHISNQTLKADSVSKLYVLSDNSFSEMELAEIVQTILFFQLMEISALEQLVTLIKF